MVDTYADEPAAGAAPDEGTDRDDAVEPAESSLSDRLALWVFAAYIAVAFFVILLVLGDVQWFKVDEWTFLAERDTFDPADYLEPMNGHFVAAPLLVYRALFEVFGLHSYVPYQVPIVVMHLTAACLLRVIMRRLEVNAWIATVVAGSFVLFGAGEDNIVWGFQITLVGSLVGGLAHMILSDHDGPIDRRDWIGLAFGFFGLASSGVAVMMTIAVGIAVLIRRGWRKAAFHTVPLGVVYLLWYLVYRPSVSAEIPGMTIGDRLNAGRDYMWAGVSNVFGVLGDGPVLGVILAAMLVVGLALAWLPLDRAGFRRVAGMPLGLLAGALLVLLSALWSRGFVFGTIEARAPRYVHIVVALTLPALAVAANALARPSRWLVPVVVLPFLVGIPANVDQFEKSIYNEQYFAAQRHLVVGIGRSELADDVPSWVQPEPFQAPKLTMGWLRRTIDEGKMPDAEPPDPTDAAWPLRLGLAQVHEDIPDTTKCTPLRKPIDRTPDEGKVYGVEEGNLVVTLLEDGKPAAPPLLLNPAWGGRVLKVTLPDLELRFQPPMGETVVFCS